MILFSQIARDWSMWSRWSRVRTASCRRWTSTYKRTTLTPSTSSPSCCRRWPTFVNWSPRTFTWSKKLKRLSQRPRSIPFYRRSIKTCIRVFPAKGEEANRIWETLSNTVTDWIYICIENTVLRTSTVPRVGMGGKKTNALEGYTQSKTYFQCQHNPQHSKVWVWRRVRVCKWECWASGIICCKSYFPTMVT